MCSSPPVPSFGSHRLVMPRQPAASVEAVAAALPSWLFGTTTLSDRLLSKRVAPDHVRCRQQRRGLVEIRIVFAVS